MCGRDVERLSKPLRHGDDVMAYRAQARERVARGGGAVLQVHSECGDRISYGPYRATSRAIIKLLQGCACAGLQNSMDLFAAAAAASLPCQMTGLPDVGSPQTDVKGVA